MSGIAVNWETLRRWRLAIVSTMSAFVSLCILIYNIAIWIDQRYMYKSISDSRWLHNQEMILEVRLEIFHDRIDRGLTLDPEDQIQYDLLRQQLDWVKQQQNRSLGIGVGE